MLYSCLYPYGNSGRQRAKNTRKCHCQTSFTVHSRLTAGNSKKIAKTKANWQFLLILLQAKWNYSWHTLSQFPFSLSLLIFALNVPLAHANQLPLPRLQSAAVHESCVSSAISSIQIFTLTRSASGIAVVVIRAWSPSCRPADDVKAEGDHILAEITSQGACQVDDDEWVRPLSEQPRPAAAGYIRRAKPACPSLMEALYTVQSQRLSTRYSNCRVSRRLSLIWPQAGRRVLSTVHTHAGWTDELLPSAAVDDRRPGTNHPMTTDLAVSHN